MKKLLAILLFASSAFAQTISSIEPASGPTSGGTFVHITGTDLTGLPLACPALACGNYVQFGDTLGSISVNNDFEIVAIAPAHAAGAFDLIVNIAGKKMITLPAGFRYEAADSNTVTFVLMPILEPDVPGAFGSLWHTDASITNNSDTPLSISYGNCLGPGVPVCVTVTALPHQTASLLPLESGVFLPIPRDRINDIDISLRVVDLSRQSQTWGTAIPVVRQIDFRRVTRLHNVPTASAFRVALRMYNYPGVFSSMRLRIFDESTAALLVTDVLTTFNPQISSLVARYPQIAGHDRVRVEVESGLEPQRPIWAFVSVTNNETQHVTVIAPSP